jgi:hypothetical protein
MTSWRIGHFGSVLFFSAVLCFDAVAAAEPVGAPEPYQKGVGEVAVQFVPAGGGTWKTSTADVEASGSGGNFGGSYSVVALVGLRLAGYAALGSRFQFGGFAAANAGRLGSSFSAEGAEPASETHAPALDGSAGLTLKLGRLSKRNVFVGLAEDLGLAFFHANLRAPDVRALFGIAETTRFVVEKPVNGDCRIAFAIGVELFIVRGRALESTDALTGLWFRVQPVIHLGVVFGK